MECCMFGNIMGVGFLFFVLLFLLSIWICFFILVYVEKFLEKWNIGLIIINFFLRKIIFCLGNNNNNNGNWNILYVFLMCIVGWLFENFFYFVDWNEIVEKRYCWICFLCFEMENLGFYFVYIWIFSFLFYLGRLVYF